MTKKEILRILDKHADKNYGDILLNQHEEIANELLKYFKKQLRLYDVVKSLPIQDLPNCNRVEVIDQEGRSYVNWKPTNKVKLSMQDDGRTVKIFID